MLIVHEGLEREAKRIRRELLRVFDIPVEIEELDLEGVFPSVKKGFFWSPSARFLMQDSRARLILTSRDLYWSENPSEDDWVFGVSYLPSAVCSVSTARLEQNRRGYLDRLCSIAVHEAGHSVVRGRHLRNAYYVNAQSGKKFFMGPHCHDSRCVLYPSIDMRAPSSDESYLRFGKDKRFDGGLDELVKRRYPDWFCKKCKDSVVLDERYS